MKRPLALTLLALAGCGEPIDKASDIRSLRVLAVRADQPFARPGADVELSMLWHDGSRRAVLPDGSRRAVQVLWMGQCVNPPGDLYSECYPTLRAAMAGWTDQDLRDQIAPAGVADKTTGFGDSFTVAVPPTVISNRKQAAGVVHPFGVVYVFFAACAGQLRLSASRGVDDPFPVTCADSATGQALGPDDFEIGYYPIYAYDDISNRNPGLLWAALSGTTPGAACEGPSDCEPGAACGSQGLCIPAVGACGAEDPDDCPWLLLTPRIDESAMDRAVTANLTEAQAPWETWWVAYFATGGSFREDLRMVFDPGAGWRGDVGGVWRACAPPGTEVRLWAVLRDSRNGVAWSWQDVMIE